MKYLAGGKPLPSMNFTGKVDKAPGLKELIV